jgi:hypothetical protein
MGTTKVHVGYGRAAQQLLGSKSSSFVLRFWLKPTSDKSGRGTCIFSLALLAFLGLISNVSHAQSSSLWLGSGDTLSEVDSISNQLYLSVFAGDIGKMQALAATADGEVWVVGDKRLLKVAANGTTPIELDAKSLGLGGAVSVLLNPYDLSLWLASGKSMFHLDANGQMIGKATLPAVSRAVDLGVDEYLWVLGNKELWRYSPQGKLVASYDLHTLLKEEPKYIAVDTLGGRLWVVGEKQLVQLDLNAPDRLLWDLPLPKPAQALALDAKNGIAFVLMEDLLSMYQRDGMPVSTVSLATLQIEKTQAMAFDAISQSLWLGHKNGLARFTVTGELQANFPVGGPAEKLGVAPLMVTPTLTLLQPLDDAWISNPQPTITLGLDAFCFEVSCGFGTEYTVSYSLNALLDNKQIRNKFQFNSDSGQSNYTPDTRLEEGLHNFNAQAIDQFGHQSNSVSASFTVDTIPPRLLAVSPSDGSVFTGPQIIVSGTVDDEEAWVLLNGMTNPMNGLNVNFSFPVLLELGVNTLNLSAYDKAANLSTVDLHLTYAPDISVSVGIDSPTTGANIAGNSVLVSGAFQGLANTGVTVNGIVASQNGNRYYASVPLVPGTNTLTAVATGPDGVSATQSISINSSGASPISVNVEPASGIAPLKTTFSVQNNTATVLGKLQVDFDGNDTVDFTTTDQGAKIETTYVTPGIYQARVAATDSLNNVFTQTVLVSVQDGAQMDQMFRTIFDGMNAALVNGNKSQALRYLNRQAQAKYGPVFDALMPQMRSIVTSYSPLRQVSVSQNIGEFAINRTIDGIDRIYFIYFLLDVDGVWRLDSM